MLATMHGRQRRWEPTPWLTPALAFVVGWTGPMAARAAPFNEGDWAERSRAVLAPFKAELAATLRQGLEQGSEHAIRVCQVQAPTLGAQFSGEQVEVGRTSHRLRNPDNRPRDWIQPLLEDQLTDPESRESRVVRLPDGGVGYVEPIVVQPLCLTCHGASLDSATTTALRERYPNDEATGFRLGEFRGLFWVQWAESAALTPPAEPARRHPQAAD
ncbi:MAG: DUF3365 domain-containing protein [Pseudomonadota bacterium]|nr:DUF3365 domain-containing protein [Pseudomonadota bacterium]